MSHENNCGCGTTGPRGVYPANQNLTCCSGPCRVTETNSAACESLPSQISNFTLQFFGTVVKTEVDGDVIWSLPCNLETGLPNNPRAADEGLACYFLRLFNDGIIGLIGPAGETGATGANGANAFTVTLAAFAQPTLAAPNVQISAMYNPAMLVGEYIFIATSGWYLVTNTDPSGSLFLTLTKPLATAPAVITAGKLVVPAGYPGASVQGQQGIQGPKGDTGSSGVTLTSTNGLYSATIGTNYNLQIAYASVNFTNSSPANLLPDAGTYMVDVVVDVLGLAGVALSDIATLKLRNTSNASDVPGSEHMVSNLVADQRTQLVISSLVTTDGTNQTIALQGKASTADKIALVALHTTFRYVRIA